MDYRVFIAITLLLMTVTLLFLFVYYTYMKRRYRFATNCPESKELTDMIKRFRMARIYVEPVYCSDGEIARAWFELSKCSSAIQLSKYYSENRQFCKTDKELLIRYAKQHIIKNKKHSKKYIRFFVAYFNFLLCICKQCSFIEKRGFRDEDIEDSLKHILNMRDGIVDYDFYNKDEYCAAYKELTIAYNKI